MNKEPSGKRGGQLNFNTAVGMVAVAAIGWVGTSVTKLGDSMGKMREDMARITASIDYQDRQAVAVEKRVTLVEAIIGVKPKQP